MRTTNCFDTGLGSVLRVRATVESLKSEGGGRVDIGAEAGEEVLWLQSEPMKQHVNRNYRKILLVRPLLEVTSAINNVSEGNWNDQRTSMKPATPSVLDF
jgi:hypothetical protein